MAPLHGSHLCCGLPPASDIYAVGLLIDLDDMHVLARRQPNACLLRVHYSVTEGTLCFEPCEAACWKQNFVNAATAAGGSRLSHNKRPMLLLQLVSAAALLLLEQQMPTRVLLLSSSATLA